MLDHIESTLQVYIDNHVEILFLHGEDQLIPYDAGVVHQNIDAAEFLDNLFHHFLGSLEAGNVADIHRALDPKGLDFLLGLLRLRRVA